MTIGTIAKALAAADGEAERIVNNRYPYDQEPEGFLTKAEARLATRMVVYQEIIRAAARQLQCHTRNCPPKEIP